jgi:threonine aldolase
MSEWFPQRTEHLIDLRSDTVTRPTPEMFEAMRTAPLGDDVLGDDPTVMRLEEVAAAATGKEAAVFVPSGTMGNQIAIATHCRPGDALIAEEESHVLYYEVGGPAVFAQAVSWTIASRSGVMAPDDVEARILKRSLHTPGTSLICIENTHNRAGGTIIPLEVLAAYQRIATEHQVQIHMDGARVFNAAVAQGVPVDQITRHADSVTICLSKGLRAPVGSVLCGTTDFIDHARTWRKRLGGGMRQAGLLAACGILSLTKMVDRLAEDHDRAKRLAHAIDELPGLSVDLESVQTNIVVVRTEDSPEVWQSRLAERDVLCLPFGRDRIRLVLHADVDDEKIDLAIEAFRSLAAWDVEARSV